MNMLGVSVVVLCILALSANAEGGSCDASEANACEVRMRTDAGWVCGRLRIAEGRIQYASFRGVPYAKPPVAERRFKELEPLDPWDGYLHATEDSAACPQQDILYGRLTLNLKGESEDCIYLNLHVPFKALPNEDVPNMKQNPGVPILVMIHGGGFHSGSGLTDLHGPEYLMTKEVIVISFNYRLNVFGFLSLNTKEVPGNQGLRDQVTLLRWVQRNARAFGGDPDNVTLIGQSAGATCVHILSLSKATKGLFHRTILMSGSAVPNFFTASPKYAKDIANMFFNILGIESIEPDEIHKQLTELPLVNIMQAYTVIQQTLGLAVFVPVVEQEYPGVTRILDDDPLELIAKGRGKEYPMLIGFTKNEAEFFRLFCLKFDIMRKVAESPYALLTPRHVYNRPPEELVKLANEVSQKYFNGTPTLDKFLDHLSDKSFKYPAIKLAAWRALGDAPVYLYKYTYESERSLIKEALWTQYEGATHVEDLTYVFRVGSMMGDYVSFPPKNNDDRMKDWMTTIVSNFMRFSHPTPVKDESAWPRLSPNSIQYQNIAEPMVYKMMKPTAEEVDMLQFMDGIDVECRHVTEQLEGVAKS